MYGESNMETYIAAAAKSLQSCPSLCDPIDGSPPGSPIPGILQARTLEWVAICKTESQGEFAVCLRKLKQGLCVNLEGWDGEGEGREVQKGGDICIPMADSG